MIEKRDEIAGDIQKSAEQRLIEAALGLRKPVMENEVIPSIPSRAEMDFAKSIGFQSGLAGKHWRQGFQDVERERINLTVEVKSSYMKGYEEGQATLRELVIANAAKQPVYVQPQASKGMTDVDKLIYIGGGITILILLLLIFDGSKGSVKEKVTDGLITGGVGLATKAILR